MKKCELINECFLFPIYLTNTIEDKQLCLFFIYTNDFCVNDRQLMQYAVIE